MFENKDTSGTICGGDGVGAARAGREARAARRGAGGAAPSVDSGSGHENDDVELISLGDKPGVGGAEPSLAGELGGKTGAGGAKPNYPLRKSIVKEARFLDISTSSLYPWIQLEYVACLLHCKLNEFGNHLEHVAIRTCNLQSTAAKYFGCRTEAHRPKFRG